MLKVMSLSKRYPGAKTLAVDDVSFGTAVGENFALIGPNGAGKSSSLACIRGVVSWIRAMDDGNVELMYRKYRVKGMCWWRIIQSFGSGIKLGISLECVRSLMLLTST